MLSCSISDQYIRKPDIRDLGKIPEILKKGQNKIPYEHQNLYDCKTFWGNERSLQLFTSDIGNKTMSNLNFGLSYLGLR